MISTPSKTSLSASPACLELLQTIIAERYPFQTVILLGGGCCDGRQPQLVDKLVLSPYVDQLIGTLNFQQPVPNTSIYAIEIYASPSAQTAVADTPLFFDLLPIPDNKVSDSFSLEIPHGVQLVL